jgi:hypothetical protein
MAPLTTDEFDYALEIQDLRNRLDELEKKCPHLAASRSHTSRSHAPTLEALNEEENEDDRSPYVKLEATLKTDRDDITFPDLLHQLLIHTKDNVMATIKKGKTFVERALSCNCNEMVSEQLINKHKMNRMK